MINTLLTMSLTGSSVVVLWWLLAKWSGDRFSARWHYGVLKLGIFGFLVPVERLLTALLLAGVPNTPKIPTEVLGPAAVSPTAPSAVPNAAPNLPLPAAAAQSPELVPLTVPVQLAQGLAVVWAVGTAALLFYKLWTYSRFRRKVLGNNTAVTDPAALDLLRSCQRQVGVEAWVTLEQNPYLQTALVTGLLRPVLVIPDIGLSQGELRYIFLHELTHIKNRDLWVRRLALAAVCLHWWNPCVHLLAREVRGISERNCDEQVAAPMSRQERYEYGTVILKVAAEAMTVPEEWGAPFSVRRSLERRLNTVLNSKKMSQKAKALSVAAAALVLVCGTGMALSADRFLPEQAEKPDSGTAEPSQSQQPGEPSKEEPITYTVPELPLPDESLPEAAAVDTAKEPEVQSGEAEPVPNEPAAAGYERNSRGETYGPRSLASTLGYKPDLIEVIGDDGVRGYIRESDFPREFPTLEEAIAYFQEDRDFVYCSRPLYNSEGEEIGKFNLVSLRHADEVGTAYPEWIETQNKAASQHEQLNKLSFTSLEQKAAALPEDFIFIWPEDEELFWAWENLETDKLRAQGYTTYDTWIGEDRIIGDYARNSRGETYGINTLSCIFGHSPDLIPAVGTLGESGYIRERDQFTGGSREEYTAWVAAHIDDYTIPLYDSEGNVIGEYEMPGYGEAYLIKKETEAEAERLRTAYEKAKAEGIPFEEGDESYPWEENPALAAAMQAAQDYPNYGTVNTDEP